MLPNLSLRSLRLNQFGCGSAALTQVPQFDRSEKYFSLREE
jgi:hypothetical protein